MLDRNRVKFDVLRIATFAVATLVGGFAQASAAATLDTVNPGDQLNVVVYNHPELSQQVRVDSRGGISLPLAGYFAVSGLRLHTIDSRIERRLARYVRYPAVDVQSVGEIENIFIAGGPGGVLPFSPGETLSTAVSDVEKNLSTRASQDSSHLILLDTIDHSRLDLRRVAVLRSGKQLGIYDTVALRGTPNPGPLLHANDTVVFQNKPVRVAVGGSVAKPGYAYLDANEQLSDAIEQVGGSLGSAATSHIVLRSSAGAARSVALGDAVFSQPAVADENVFVPAAPRVEVNGLVAKPGPVVLQTDFTLLGAINNAGGINKYANIKNVQVVSNGKTTSYDITRLTFGDLTQNPTLQDGDAVFVPEGHKVDFTTVFSSIVGARNLIP